MFLHGSVQVNYTTLNRHKMVGGVGPCHNDHMVPVIDLLVP